MACRKDTVNIQPPKDTFGYSVSLRNNDTLAIMQQLFTSVSNSYLSTGINLDSTLNPQWDNKFQLNDSVILVPINNIPEALPFSWGYLYFNISDDILQIYSLNLIPDFDFTFIPTSWDEFKQDFTGWAVVTDFQSSQYVGHYADGTLQSIGSNSNHLEASFRTYGYYETFRWWEWRPKEIDNHFGNNDSGGRYYTICPNCKIGGKGSCPKMHCPYCDPSWKIINLNDLGNNGGPIIKFFPNNSNNGNNTNGGGAGGNNDFFTNIPSDFIKDFIKLDRECQEFIKQIAQNVSLTPQAWQCMGQSCGIAGEDGGSMNSMMSDLVDVLNNELKDVELKDPCNPNKSHEKLMSELIASLCNSEYMGREDILKALDGLDHIHIPSIVKNQCPKYACILDKMISGGLGTSFVCDLLSGFDGSNGNNNGSGFELHFNVADFSLNNNYENSAYAGTSPIFQTSNDLRLMIMLNTLNCNTLDGVTVFETIQHELIHADIKRRLIEDHGWNGGLLTLTEAFHQLVVEEYGGQAGEDEHNLMLEHYLTEMVNSLIEMNNGIGSYADFVGLVLNGFPIEALNYCGVMYQDVAVHYDHFLGFIQQPGSVNQLLLSCE